MRACTRVNVTDQERLVLNSEQYKISTLSQVISYCKYVIKITKSYANCDKIMSAAATKDD